MNAYHVLVQSNWLQIGIDLDRIDELGLFTWYRVSYLSKAYMCMLLAYIGWEIGDIKKKRKKKYQKCTLVNAHIHKISCIWYAQLQHDTHISDNAPYHIIPYMNASLANCVLNHHDLVTRVNCIKVLSSVLLLYRCLGEMKNINVSWNSKLSSEKSDMLNRIKDAAMRQLPRLRLLLFGFSFFLSHCSLYSDWLSAQLQCRNMRESDSMVFVYVWYYAT